MTGPIFTRRQFGKSLTGIVVAFRLAPETAWSADAGLPGNLGAAPTLDAWLRIDSEGKVTVFTGKVEIGQGILTALAQIAAEELDVSLTTHPHGLRGYRADAQRRLHLGQPVDRIRRRGDPVRLRRGPRAS